jgi:ligand-binding sensor domain-containing protein
MKKMIMAVIATVIIVTTNVVNAQWQKTSGPNSVFILSIAIKGNDIFAATASNGVYLSSNNGNSWTAVNTGLNYGYSVYALTMNGSDIFAGTDNGIFMSSNNGNSWTAVNNGVPASTGIMALTIKGDTVFAGTLSGLTDNGVLLSTNDGNNWTAGGLTGYRSVYSFAKSGNNIFAGTSCCGVYVSSGGNSWTQVITGLTITSNIYALAVSGSNIFAGTGGGVFISSNNGNNWTAVNTGLTGYSLAVYALAVSGSNIFAGTGGGVFVSSNNGNNWTAVNTGLTDTTGISSLAVAGNYLFAGTDSTGVWKRPLSEMTGINEINSEKTNVSVYPNPFTDQINVKTDAGKNVDIALYDITGRMIDQYKVSGYLAIKTDNLPHGVYFVKVASKDGISAKEIVK